MARIVMLQGGEATPYEISGRAVVGRHPDCDVQLQSNMVSRKHAQFYQDNSGWVIEDMGSGNGSFVNGRRINGPTRLSHQDRVKLGPLLLRFEDAASAPVAQFGEPDDEESGFRFDMSEEDAGSTIMGSIDDASGFGLLDVQPEAKLKAVLEISRGLAGTHHDLDRLLPKILDTLFSIFPHADRGCVLLKDELTGGMIPRAYKHRQAEVDDSVKLSRTIVNKVLEEKTAILSADAASDDRFEASESISNLTIRSMMCAPLLSMDGEPLGLINIDTQNPVAQFRKEDLDIMVAVAGQAALAYEGARLLQSYVAKQKQDNEMDIARRVQHALLPEEMPHVDGYQFFASYESAQAVGGDYYDIIPLADGKLCLAFGDVAGKGVPASLVMSRMSSVVRNTMEFVTDVAEAMTRINNHMCAKAVEGRFVTFVLTVLDTANHQMSVVNAGHMSPMIRKPDGSIEEFDEETIGVPVGVVEDYPFEKVERDLATGETVVIYTDGVSEAMNPESELYGMEKLREVVSKSPPEAAEMGAIIREDVRKHANGREQNDDITMMGYGRNP